MTVICAVFLTLAPCGAPVPKESPRERPVTADALVGQWNVSWGGWGTGVIAFHADGSYTCVRVPQTDDVWYGTWKWCDGTLTLTECVHNTITNARSGPCKYTVTLDAKLTGKANGGTAVALTKP